MGETDGTGHVLYVFQDIRVRRDPCSSRQREQTGLACVHFIVGGGLLWARLGLYALLQ